MRNKGFTLIELLAVIVILAIIALIAIPMISKVIDKTEDSAVVRSVELYIDGVNQSIMRANLKDKIRPKECIIQEDGNLICDGEYEIKIEATGTKPIAGTLVIEDRAVKSFTDMILDIYELEMNEDGKIVVIEKLEESINKVVCKEPTNVHLPAGLTPVIYEDNNWVVANTSQQWYNYCNQEWANAVILKSGVTKNIGAIVNVSSEVQGMFVYVPRYEYKIEGQYGTHTDGTVGTKEQPGEIKINFISKETTKASEGYILHPAFTFGTQELSGIWIGKFETSGTASSPTVLPNVTSLRNQTLSAQYTTAQKFNTYIDHPSVDAHMLKNSEWGAVAYLSQSKYGKYGNSNYEVAERQVMINNCSNYITGVGADSQDAPESSTTCTTNTYETIKGQAASTTGNITGVYDMSGGSWEYVMGVHNELISSSGFSALPDAKYYDNYTRNGLIPTCNNGICYGHALSETEEWYNDFTSYLNASSAWFLRGGYYVNSDGAGVFGSIYIDIHGGSNTAYSFRVTIVVG